MSAKDDTDMEEGEIVDEIEDLSDISSEEEFLLRQRLEVLENYNNVLERKKAKRFSDIPGKRHKKVNKILPDLSEISATDLEDSYSSHKNLKPVKNIRQHNKNKRKDGNKKSSKNKDTKRKLHHKKRTKLVFTETSDESEDEYRNKRMKLANAVNVNGVKIDKSSLSERLKKMICSSVSYQPLDSFIRNDKEVVFENNNRLEEKEFHSTAPIVVNDATVMSEQQEKVPTEEVIKNLTNFSEFIDLCSDDHVDISSHNLKNDSNCSLMHFHKHSQPVIHIDDDTVDSNSKNEKENVNDKISSDEDLELLRQNVLKTKVVKATVNKNKDTIKYKKNFSDDEDSDTAELRLICLRSALLKKAIEMKQKQKLQKRLSHSSHIQEEPDIFSSKNESRNNTDVESVDMDIGSEDDVKMNKETNSSELAKINTDEISLQDNQKNFVEKTYLHNVNEFDEDEDLLRANLLTSLSRNLPNLIASTVDGAENVSSDKSKQPTDLANNTPAEKKFIIELGESDSEDEHEATKNLTKMHLKLSEQQNFEQKLDMFLKSTRMAVETAKQPIAIQEQLIPKKTEKFVAKAVNNLPKSEQIEYKNLVKRMAELEKIKQSRQSSIGVVNKVPANGKEKLKQHNISSAVYNNLEVQISISRKKIAEESAKMLKLKEEANKLSQKYKIVTTELRNITTAITLNKKQQRSIQNCLTNIRFQHQSLLKSTTAMKHSKINSAVPPMNLPNKIMNMTNLQKENNSTEAESKITKTKRSVKVSILQDDKDQTNPNSNLSIEVNFTRNNKVVPKSPTKTVKVVSDDNDLISLGDDKHKTDDKIVKAQTKETNQIHKYFKDNEIDREIAICNRKYKNLDDYESPLQALGASNWEADPHAILCPFEVAGECRDSDCIYLHAKNTQ